MRSSFLTAGMTCALLLTVPDAARAQGGEGDVLAAVRESYVEVTGWILRAAELVPTDQYGYRPTDGVRTFGQLVGHVADANNWYCARAAGHPIEWAETVALSGAGKAQLIAELKKSVDACTALHAPANLPRAQSLVGNLGHASLHYGNMVTYLRMLGITPPSS